MNEEWTPEGKAEQVGPCRCGRSLAGLVLRAGSQLEDNLLLL